MTHRRDVLRYQLAVTWLILLASVAIFAMIPGALGGLALAGGTGFVMYYYGRLDEFDGRESVDNDQMHDVD